MSSDKPVTKNSKWKTWVGVGGALAGIVGLGLTVHQIRIRSLKHAVKVGMNSLQEGCSFTTMSDTLVSSTIGFVERPPQVYDEMFDFSTKSYASRPFVIWAPTGTGKSEYDIKKLEERGSHFLHLMCKEDGGMNENLVGEALGIHSYQYKNSYKVCKKALSNLKSDQESPRCLFVVEHPTIDNVKEIQMLHEWNKGGFCDLNIVFSEKQDVIDIMEEMHGKQGRLLKVEYLPPTKDSFAETLKKSIEEGGSSFPFKEDDLMKLLDFVDVNFSDYGHCMEYLEGGLSIKNTIVRQTNDFKEEVEDVVSKGCLELDIDEQDFIDTFLVLQTNGKLTNSDNRNVIAYLLNQNILRTKNNHYTYHKKGIEIGVAAYLDSKKTEKL